MNGMNKTHKEQIRLLTNIGWNDKRATEIVKGKGSILPTEEELTLFCKEYNIKPESMYYYNPKVLTNHERIVELRKKQGKKFTQQFVADKSDIKISTLKSIETARMNLSEENAGKLSRVLGVESEDFYSTISNHTKVTAVVSHKGGCGKSSIASNTAYILGQPFGQRKASKVLFIDTDFQCNGSMSFGFGHTDESLTEMYSLDQNIYKALTDGKNDIRNHIISTQFDNVDIVLGSPEMSGIEINLYKAGLTPGYTLKRILKPVIDENIYDYIIIDTHATLGITNVNVLNAANELLIPLEFSLFGVMGLNGLRAFYDEIINQTNPDLYITGVVGNNVNKVRKVTKRARDQVNDLYRNKIFNTSISIDAKVQECQFDGLPIAAYDSESIATIEYTMLVDEILKIWDEDN